MTQQHILSTFLKKGIVQYNATLKRTDSVFIDTVIRLMHINADTQTLTFFLELFSLYKHIFIQNLNPLYIRKYIEMENIIGF